MQQNKSDLIINILALFFFINALLGIINIISNFRFDTGLLISLFSFGLLSTISYLLFKRNKIGWYLAIANSLVIALLTIVNLFTYKVYLGSLGIFTFEEFLANKQEVYRMISYITTAFVFNVIIFSLLFLRNVRKQFFDNNEAN